MNLAFWPWLLIVFGITGQSFQQLKGYFVERSRARLAAEEFTSGAASQNQLRKVA